MFYNEQLLLPERTPIVVLFTFVNWKLDIHHSFLQSIDNRCPTAHPRGRDKWPSFGHYRDVIMGAMASQITSVSIVYSTVCSGADQRKHQSSASLAFVRAIHRCPANSPHNGPVTRQISPFDDVIMVRSTLDLRLTSLVVIILHRIIWRAHLTSLHVPVCRTLLTNI